jgi:hypothetical protein
VPVRHSEHEAATGSQDADHLDDRSLGLGKVLDRTHRVNRVEALVDERQTANIRDTAPQRSCSKCRACLSDYRGRQIDPEDVRTLAAGPLENPGVLCFVPQIGLEQPAACEQRQLLGEKPRLVVEVVVGRGGSREHRKVAANPFPESAIDGRVVMRVARHE